MKFSYSLDYKRWKVILTEISKIYQMNEVTVHKSFSENDTT